MIMMMKTKKVQRNKGEKLLGHFQMGEVDGNCGWAHGQAQRLRGLKGYRF